MNWVWDLLGRRYRLIDDRLHMRRHYFAPWQAVQFRKVLGPVYMTDEVMQAAARDDGRRRVIGLLLGKRTWTSEELRTIPALNVQQIAELLVP